MKLYDFSFYAARRDAIQKEEAARAAVIEVVSHIEEPGSVTTLKQRVNGWFLLHRNALEKAIA